MPAGNHNRAGQRTLLSRGQDPRTKDLRLSFQDIRGRDVEVRLPPEMLKPLGFGVDALRLARKDSQK